MDLESDYSVLESVKDTEEIANGSVPKIVGNTTESTVYSNGPALVENNVNEVFPVVKQKGTEVLGHLNSPSVDSKSESSASPSVPRKGFGLRKWRRIRRDVGKGDDRPVNTGNKVTRDSLDSSANSSKRILVSSERKQRSEGSVSSTNAVVRILDGFVMPDDIGFELGQSFATGTDSENSGHQSSRSSTAASGPKIRHDKSVVAGILHNKNKMKSLSGKNAMHSVPSDLQGTIWNESSWRSRGKQVKIDNDNSQSSLESDSQSSSVVFMRGKYSRNVVMQNEQSEDYEGEIGNENQGCKQVSGEHQGDYDRYNEGEFEGLSTGDVTCDTSSNHDPLVDSIVALQSAQDALEKEVHKFKDIGNDISVDESSPDSHTEYIDIAQKGKNGSCENDGISNKDTETDFMDLFKQTIEAELVNLVISRKVQELKVTSVDLITVLEEQNAMLLDQKQMLDKLGDVENKASAVEKEAEKLENFVEDIASSNETLKLQTRVRKYSFCFFMQLVLLVVVTLSMYEKSLNYVAPVAT